MARARLEELRLDYEDFLRHRGLPLWGPDDPRRQSLVDRRCRSVEGVAAWVQQIHESGRRGLVGLIPGSTPSTRSAYPEVAANAALTLINVASALLDRQISAQAAAFERDGGFTERLYRVRSQKRQG